MKLSLLAILTTFFFSGFFVSDAFAYIDPGTGSLFIQALVGALVGVGIAIKIYWYKFKEKLMRSPKNDD